MASDQPSARVYGTLRAAILHGGFPPGAALKPGDLAARHGVSLAVVREGLLRLVGEGLAERLPNRGFVVPAADDARWATLAEARAVVEPEMLRLAMARGDLTWEAAVRAAHHRLAGTPAYEDDDGDQVSEAWSAAHHDFHRALLEACANAVLLDSFERMWVASELTRRWSAAGGPRRNHAAEHRRLEQAALRRDPTAVDLLRRHVTTTAANLTRASAPESARRA